VADVPRDGWTETHAELARAAGWQGWEAWCRAREQELDRKICGRRNKQDEPCGLSAGHQTDHPGRGACKFHGGASPRGKEHGQYKHGGYVEGFSLYYPEGLQQKIEEAREIDELQLLRETIRYHAGRIAEKMERLREQENVHRPRQLRDAADEVMAAMRAGNADEMYEALQELRGLASAAADEEEAYREVERLMGRMDGHIQSQWKILKEAQQLVQLEWIQDRMMAMVQEMKQAVRQEVSDPEEQRRVLQRVARATGEWARQHEERMTGNRMIEADSSSEDRPQHRAVG
jgi:hypothetical protein